MNTSSSVLPFDWDYIIAGGGLSGLTLAAEIAKNPAFAQKKILLVDKDQKRENDRTWCFWALPADEIPDVAVKKWDNCLVNDIGFEKKLHLHPYQYYMVRGLDYYRYALQLVEQSPNIQRLQAVITKTDAQTGEIFTDDGKCYRAHLILKSYFEKSDISIPKSENFVWQHFKGWYIRTEEPVFDSKTVKLMDFRIAQNGATRFFYVVPITPTFALVEYTLFSPTFLQQNEYDEALKMYISTHFGNIAYKIEEEEFNAIPMTDFLFRKNIEGRVVRIGTMAGFVKPSTGYCFTRTIHRIRKIVALLADNQIIKEKHLRSAYRYRLYDSIFLEVIAKNLLPPNRVFSRLFRLLPDVAMFRFLDEKTTFWQDLQVLASAPPFFGWVVLKNLRKWLRV